MRAEGAMGETDVRLDIQTIAHIPEPSGIPHSAVIKRRRATERLGDCSQTPARARCVKSDVGRARWFFVFAPF
ncbi:hypothetical protein ASE85_10475 [Sphingobium sp. Leaf26]|nr:hypothetical protein ASE85_10475 [Sphingobium sp. Leaf26]